MSNFFDNPEAKQQLYLFFQCMTPWKQDKISRRIAKYLDGEDVEVPFQDKIDECVDFIKRVTEDEEELL